MIQVFGIRHHGPGSARSLGEALAAFQPDVVLVEGPPDAQAVLPLLMHSAMEPPVALLIYAPDNLQQAVYYPFAVFSPEWQALRYGMAQQIPVRFMDLPQAHQFALSRQAQAEQPGQEEPNEEPSQAELTGEAAQRFFPEGDPLGLLATAAGYADGERWWEHMVEQRQDSTELFAAILEAMTVLRTAVENPAELPVSPAQAHREACREAYMRKTIREAQKAGFQKIAVVCGAWHAPALAQMPPAKADTALLKGLPKLKVEATWVPWTYGRLLMSSGYGAGIESPGWYHHLWEMGERIADHHQRQSAIAIHWMTRVAQALRSQDLDASSASLIEAVRLAETLAALRDRSVPGLPELNEATQTVLCFGDPVPLQCIQQQLMVGERLGTVPTETPMVPLQQDLHQQQKRLRLQPEATERLLELDLRKPGDRERSHLLHRLALLKVPWGQPQYVGKTKGTFRESWRLQWQPEFAVGLIEAGIWGNTIETAATAWTGDRAEKADLPTLTQLIDQALLANLPEAITHLMHRLQAEAALASDITHLMGALPSLVNVLRYGTVRQFETEVISHVVEGLITRVCIGLPVAVASLDDAAAETMHPQLIAVHGAINLWQNPAALEQWQGVLIQMANQQGLHGLLAGRCCRLLFDAGQFSVEDTARRLGLALSLAIEPAQAAAWLEGFLSGSGLLLLHNPTLWQVLDRWLLGLADATFTTLLPLLRRTFATFPMAERRQMGEQVRQQESGRGSTATPTVTPPPMAAALAGDRADAVLPLVAQLLGLQPSPNLGGGHSGDAP